jgi:SAM-dependent methyltransferase
VASTHWDAVYRDRLDHVLTWYQPSPAMSLALLHELGVTTAGAILDIGGGTSRLADSLLAEGYVDVTVLDVSRVALDRSALRLVAMPGVSFVEADVRDWRPDRTFDVWHDRAVFHFMTEEGDRDAYRRTLDLALAPDGCLVVATFAADGPTGCSGLPVARYDADALAAEFPGFTPVADAREDHVTPRGDLQPFTWVALRRR